MVAPYLDLTPSHLYLQIPSEFDGAVWMKLSTLFGRRPLDRASGPLFALLMWVRWVSSVPMGLGSPCLLLQVAELNIKEIKERRIEPVIARLRESARTQAVGSLGLCFLLREAVAGGVLPASFITVGLDLPAVVVQATVPPRLVIQHAEDFAVGLRLGPCFESRSRFVTVDSYRQLMVTEHVTRKVLPTGVSYNP
jgi:hypothetical protein